MKELKILTILTSLVFLTLFGCKEEEKIDPVDEKEEELIDEEESDEPEEEFKDFPLLVDTLVTEFNLQTQDSITIKFTEDFKGFGVSNEYVFNEEVYFANLKSLVLSDLLIDTIWSDSKTLKIWSRTVFPTDRTLKLTLDIEWIKVEQIIEEFSIEFTVNASGDLFPSDNIITSYPQNLQYHFLKDEYDTGFFLVKRVPLDINGLKAEIFDAHGNLMSSSDVEIDENRPRLNFDLPELDNEQIYSVILTKEDAEIYNIDFRTSKFNTFLEKANTIQFTSKVLRDIIIQWGHEKLIRYGTTETEGFDLAEINSATETVGTYDYPYSTGLIQLEFDPTESSFYNEKIYPMVYEPFPDTSFEPEYPYHPNLGEIPLRAMQFYISSDLAVLTEEEISSGISTPIADPVKFIVEWYFQSVVAWDFSVLKEQVTEKYGENTNNSDRVERVISGSMPYSREETYKCKMIYTLPDGTATSSESFEFPFDI